MYSVRKVEMKKTRHINSGWNNRIIYSCMLQKGLGNGCLPVNDNLKRMEKQ